MPWDDSRRASAATAGFYRRIWDLSGRSQILLIALSVAVAMLAAVPLYFQKELVNGLTYGISMQMLFVLGAQYAATLVVTIAIKSLLKYKITMLGEAVVLRIRKRIFAVHAEDRRVDSPPKLASGTLVSMLTAEADGVGHFVGEAFATPLVQIGTLLSVLLYIAASEPLLGLFILAVVAPQIFFIIGIQKPINEQVRIRLELLRAGSDRAVDREGTWPDDAVYETFDGVYAARRRIHILKLSLKSVINAFTAFGNVGTLVLGGWLVIKGDTDVGTVVAALNGLSRIARPWNDLIAFYRTLSTVRVRFALLEETMR